MKAAKVLFLAPLLMGTSAIAQDVAEQPAAEAQAAAVSQDEVDRFARAALAVEQIAADAALDQDEKQAAMMEAVKTSGLEPQRFNDIARASQSDTALQERIQIAAAQQLQATQQNQ